MNDIKFENDEMSLEERVADLEKAVKEQCETIGSFGFSHKRHSFQSDIRKSAWSEDESRFFLSG